MDAKEFKELIGKYSRVFSGKDGDAVMADLEKRCFVHSTTFNENHGRFGFNEGRRSIYDYIWNMKNKRVEQDEDLQRTYTPNQKPKES